MTTFYVKTLNFAANFQLWLRPIFDSILLPKESDTLVYFYIKVRSIFNFQLSTFNFQLSTFN
jgi:hypothetical protein